MDAITRRWHDAAGNWKPDANWIQVETIDAHTAGEPLRIIVAGYPNILGKTILQQREFVRANLDTYRQLLMLEPRGHADMYGCLIVPPNTDDADFGVLFLHHAGYSSMCGHGIIAVTKAAIDVGLVDATEPKTTIHIDSPAGRIVASADVHQRRAGSVTFDNVASFVVELDASVNVPSWGEIRFDLAFGGAYYAYVDAGQLGIDLIPAHVGDLIQAGRDIKRAVADNFVIDHPLHAELSFLYGIIFIGPAQQPGRHSRHVCIFADGQVDRSPTGTGVSGRAAIEHARGRLPIGQENVVESILGTTFTVEVARTTQMGEFAGVIPRVGGQAFLTGRHWFFVDPADPLKRGFSLR